MQVSGACCRRARPGTALVVVQDNKHIDQLVVQMHVKPLAAYGGGAHG